MQRFKIIYKRIWNPFFFFFFLVFDFLLFLIFFLAFFPLFIWKVMRGFFDFLHFHNSVLLTQKQQQKEAASVANIMVNTVAYDMIVFYFRSKNKINWQQVDTHLFAAKWKREENLFPFFVYFKTMHNFEFFTLCVLSHHRFIIHFLFISTYRDYYCFFLLLVLICFLFSGYFLLSIIIIMKDDEIVWRIVSDYCCEQEYLKWKWNVTLNNNSLKWIL